MTDNNRYKKDIDNIKAIKNEFIEIQSLTAQYADVPSFSADINIFNQVIEKLKTIKNIFTKITPDFIQFYKIINWNLFEIIKKIEPIKVLEFILVHRPKIETQIDNIINIDELRKIIINRDKKVAAFIGAGTSKFLGIPDWETLISEMAKHYNWNEIQNINNLEIDGIKKILNKKKEDESKSFPQLAQEIFDTKDDVFFFKFLSEYCQPSKGTHYSIHIKLWNTFDIILTTNFDKTFELAHEDINHVLISRDKDQEKLKLQYLGKFKFDEFRLNKNEKLLCYLHGKITNNEVIFRENDYKKHYPICFNDDTYSQGLIREDLEIHLKQIIENYSLVFIGFSLGDETYKKFYKKFNKKNIINIDDKNNRINDYLIVSENLLKTKISKFEFINKLGEDFKKCKGLFTNPNEDELEFKIEAQKEIDNIKYDLEKEKRDYLDKKYSDFSNTLMRIQFFKDMDIKLIVYNNHNDVEEILLELKIKSLFTENLVGEKDEASST